MRRAALFVGVNRYEDPEINPLQFAESDATELYAFFKHRAGYDEVRNLLNPDSDVLLDTASEMVAGLAPDDLFLFFFAGHGAEYEGRHLLLCPKARYGRLKYHQHAVPLDLLKQETARTGLHRVLILDACRTDLLKGHRGASTGLRDVQCLRDVVTSESVSAGSLAILCSCDEGQQARELPQLRQGLFTRALLNVFEDAHRQSISLMLSDDLESNLIATMRDLSSGLSMTTDQRPWIQKSGLAPPLLLIQPALPGPESPMSGRHCPAPFPPKRSQSTVAVKRNTANKETHAPTQMPVSVACAPDALPELHQAQIKTLPTGPTHQSRVRLMSRSMIVLRVVVAGLFLLGGGWAYVYVPFDAWRAKNHYLTAYSSADHADLKKLAPLEYAAMLEVGRSGRMDRERAFGEEFGKGFESNKALDRARSYRKAIDLLETARIRSDQNRQCASMIEDQLLPQVKMQRTKAESAKAASLASDAWQKAETVFNPTRRQELLDAGGFEYVKADLQDAIRLYQNALAEAHHSINMINAEAQRHGGLDSYLLQLKQKAHRLSQSEIQSYYEKHPGARAEFNKSKGMWFQEPPVFSRIRGIASSLSKADELLQEGKHHEAYASYQSAINSANQLRDDPAPADSRFKINGMRGDLEHRSRLSHLRGGL